MSWLFNQSRSGANHSRIKVGRSWTARSVVQEEKREEINRVVQDELHQTLGTSGALKVYQKAVGRIWGRLTTEEQAQAATTATSWNLERGPPDNVKARYVLPYIP